VTEALQLMHNESITSLPVLDNQANVIGNISHVDTRLLTSTASLPLLRSTCIHFIAVILSERGVDDGKDPYPVFHVNPFSTLAHTVAKLVATRSHRMWIVDEPSPSSSGPPTPALTPATLAPPPGPLSGGHSSTVPTPIVTPHTPQNPGNSTLTSAAMPTMSGRLTGVVSLTDILNLFARASGLNPHDPNETRRHRRRSSSASFRRSMDSDVSLAGRSTRSESEGVGGINVSRNASISGRR
jgi:CBS domain-containing protein